MWKRLQTFNAFDQEVCCKHLDEMPWGKGFGCRFQSQYFLKNIILATLMREENLVRNTVLVPLGISIAVHSSSPE